MYAIYIDQSLCVEQEDKADWTVKSANLSEIYTKAFPTIAATCVQTPHESLLSNKEGDVVIREGNTHATQRFTYTRTLAVHRSATETESDARRRGIPYFPVPGRTKSAVLPGEYLILSKKNGSGNVKKNSDVNARRRKSSPETPNVQILETVLVSVGKV